MPRLRSEIYLDDICYIDFDTHTVRCYDKKGEVQNTSLTADECIALKFLCKNYTRRVHSYDIFEAIKGRPFNEAIDDTHDLSSKISRLRKKLRSEYDNKYTDYIVNFGRSSFQLPLKESPFEDDEKEIEQLLAMNEDLKLENEKQRDEIKGLQATLADLKNKEDDQLDKDTKKATTNWFPNSTLDFFYQLVLANNKELEKVSSIDLALSDPYRWILNNENILKESIFERGVNFRVIFNIPFTRDVELLTKVSVDGFRKKTGWSRNYLDMWKHTVRTWLYLSEIRPKQIEIRRAITPILHDIYIGKGEKINCARIQYITYDNCIDTKDPVLFFRDSDDAYSLYQQEFEFMWESATKNSSINNGIFEYFTDDEKIELEDILEEFNVKIDLEDLLKKLDEKIELQDLAIKDEDV